MILAAWAALALSPLTFRLGAADISPPEPVPLGGYTARGGKLCELPGEKLEARCLVLSSGVKTLAIVSADMLTIPESLHEEVQKRLPQGVELMLVATHTHSAPDSQMLNRRMDFALPGIAKFNTKWLDWYAGRIAHGVRATLAQKPAAIEGWTVAFGRRPINRGRRAFAEPDTMATRLLDSKGTPILTHYAAHAVLYGPANLRPSPDFPGKIRGLSGLFLPGAIGDVSPASTGSSPQEQIGNFAANFEKGMWRKEALATEPFEVLKVDMGQCEVQPNPEFARQNHIPEAFAKSIVVRFAPTSGSLTLVRIGKLAMVGIPGEPSAELGRRIREYGEGLGFRQVLVLSHCNGWMGYILSPEDYDRGGYEASLGFYGRAFGALIVKWAKLGLEALAQGPKAAAKRAS